MNSSHFSHDVFISFSFKDQAVAENISNQLNHIYGIPCWICTTEIRAGDGFYDIISDAITASKVLLFVQTKNSVQSKEIPDEVCQAIGDGKTIVSFVVEDSELRGTLKLKLSGKQFVDGKKPTLDDRIEDLAHELCKILDRPFKKGGIAEAEEKEQKLKLKATPAEQLKPRKHFFGRDTLLDDLHKTFEEGERVVFLQGIGGIGKTQIAKNYVKKYGAEYDTIVYATYGGSIRDLILSDAPFTFDPPMNRLTKADGSKESDAEFFERKIAALRACATEKTLLILDNFDTIYDEQFDTLKDIGGRLLVTTRCDYSKNNRVVQIDPIEKIEDLKKVFLKNYDGYDVSEDDPALTELIELVNRHTYTIELLAQHMEISGQTAGEMVEALKKEGIRSLNEEVGAVGEKTEIAYKNLLKMFRIFSLTAEERQVLTLLSLMPLEGVNERDFRSWAELKSRKVILNLQKRSLIIENVGGIALHPIVRDVVRCEAPANEENCEVFLMNMSNRLYVAWYKPFEDNYALTGSVLSVAEWFSPFDSKKKDEKMLLIWLRFPSFLWQVGRYTESVQLAHRVYDASKKSFGEDCMITGYIAKTLAGCYFNSGRLEESIIWYEKALEIMEAVNVPECEDLAMSYEKVARCYTWEYKQNFQKAESMFKKALEIRRNLKERMIKGESVPDLLESFEGYDLKKAEERIGETYMEMGRMYQAQGNYILALTYAKMFSKTLKENCQNISSEAYGLYDMGVCHYHIGKNETKDAKESKRHFEEALNCFEGALQINDQMRSDLAIDTIDNVEYLADTYAALGRTSEAEEYYRRAIRALEIVFGRQCSRIEQVETKINEFVYHPSK